MIPPYALDTQTKKPPWNTRGLPHKVRDMKKSISQSQKLYKGRGKPKRSQCQPKFMWNFLPQNFGNSEAGSKPNHSGTQGTSKELSQRRKNPLEKRFTAPCRGDPIDLQC